MSNSCKQALNLGFKKVSKYALTAAKYVVKCIEKKIWHV